MNIKKFSQEIFVGVILSGGYVIFFIATFLSWILNNSWDAQIAAAFFSAPLSVLLLAIVRPLLQILGGYESITRQIAVWGILLISGFIQYFAAGFFIAKLWLKSDKK